MELLWRLLLLGLAVEVVVLTHLLGHLLAAWLLGVPAEVRVGLGPAVPGCRLRRGRTTVALALFPLGGYVTVPAPNPPPPDRSGGSSPPSPAAPAWKRLGVVPGGILANVFLAW